MKVAFDGHDDAFSPALFPQEIGVVRRIDVGCGWGRCGRRRCRRYSRGKHPHKITHFQRSDFVGEWDVFSETTADPIVHVVHDLVDGLQVMGVERGVEKGFKGVSLNHRRGGRRLLMFGHDHVQHDQLVVVTADDLAQRCF